MSRIAGDGGPAATPVDGGDAQHFWRRHFPFWDALTGVALLLVGGLTAADGQLPWYRRATAVVVLLALAAWYLRVGVSALRRDDQRLGVRYLAGAVGGLALLLALTPAAAFLMLMINPQIFLVVRSWRFRIAAVVAVYVEIAAAILAYEGLDRAVLVGMGLRVVLPAAATLFVGWYISGIIAQSRQRAELVRELIDTRAALADERHAAGVRGERERLSAEIHDTLAQGFSSILMLTMTARDALHREAETVDRQLGLVEQVARESLAEARSLIAALAPPDLVDRDLGDALARLAARHTRDTGVPVDVVRSGEPAGIALDAGLVLLRAVQEALANVRKHAAAGAVRIELSQGGGTSAVTVRDDGRGFDPSGVTGGYGLTGIRTRAAELGGSCVVASLPGAGTTVQVVLPARAQ